MDERVAVAKIKLSPMFSSCLRPAQGSHRNFILVPRTTVTTTTSTTTTTMPMPTPVSLLFYQHRWSVVGTKLPPNYSLFLRTGAVEGAGGEHFSSTMIFWKPLLLPLPVQQLSAATRFRALTSIVLYFNRCIMLPRFSSTGMQTWGILIFAQFLYTCQC